MVDQQDAVPQTSTTRPPVSNRSDRSQTEGMIGTAQRETSGSSAASNSISDSRRASSVQRGRFLVQKAQESNANMDSNKSHSNGSASAKLPEKKGRFLVQQVSDCENPTAVAKDRANGNMVSNNNSLGNNTIPKPHSAEGRSISDHSADPTTTNYPEDPTKQHVVDSQYDRRQTVQKGRFLVQSQQDESSTRMLAQNNNPAIPIGVIPGNQVVREKKGRFSVLEPNSVQPPEAGHAAQNNPTASPPKQIASQQPQIRTASAGMEGPANGQVPPTAAMHAAPNQAGMAPIQGQPNIPILKKKGRFVVSNMPVQAVFNNYQQEYHPQVAQPENVTMVFPTEEAATYGTPMDHGAHVDPNQHYYAASNMPPPPPPSIPPPPQQPGTGIETPLSSTSSIHKHYVPETPSCNPSPMVTTHKTDETVGAKHLAQPRRGADGGPNVKQRFGKMILFLDQMRSEVTEADRNVKTMQTNMKCMVRTCLLQL